MDLEEEAAIRKAMTLVAIGDPINVDLEFGKENAVNGVTNDNREIHENSKVNNLDEIIVDKDNKSTVEAGDVGGQGVDFEATPREIVNSLRTENQKLRDALKQEKLDLEQLTDQMTDILTAEEHDAKGTERFLLATIESGRRKIVALEMANSELVRAMYVRQNEMLRLCEEGKRLQSDYLQHIEKLRLMEAENHDIREVLERQKTREEEMDEKIQEFQMIQTSLDERNEGIAKLEKERDRLKEELEVALSDKRLNDKERYADECEKLQAEIEVLKQEITRLNLSLSQVFEQETQRTSQIIASKEEASRLQAKLTETMHSLGLRENEVVNNVKQIVELKESIEEFKRNEVEYRRREQILEGQCNEARNTAIEVERLTVSNAEAQKKVLALEMEVAEMKEAIGNGSKEYSRVTCLFDETQKLLIARDASLEEAQSKVVTLQEEVKDLQIELAKSEHLRLHGESVYQGVKDEVSLLEIELQKAREGTLEANVSMNHTQSALDAMTRRYDEVDSQLKAAMSRNNELTLELTNCQHENKIFTKEMNHLQAQLENVGQLYGRDEVETKGLRYSLRETEEKLKGVESREADMRTKYEKEIKVLRDEAEFLNKSVTKLEKDFAQSEFQRQHHEDHSKAIQEEMNTIELEALQLREDVVKVNMALSQSAKECEALKKSLEISEKRYTVADEERKTLNSNLLQAKDEQSMQNIDFIEKLNSANSKIVELSDSLSTCKGDLGSKSSDLLAANKEISNLQEMLSQSTKAVESLQQDNKKIQEEIQRLASPHGDLMRLEEEMSEREKLYVSQHSTLEEMEQVQEGLKAELREANTKTEILNEEIATLTKVMENQENSLVKLRDANNKASVEYGRISAQYEESQKVVSARDESLMDANKSIVQLKEENKDLLSQLNETKTSTRQLEEELSAASAKVAALEAELMEERASVVEVSVENSKLGELKNSLEASIVDLKCQLTQCEEKSRGSTDDLYATQSAYDLLHENLGQLHSQLQASQDASYASIENLRHLQEKNLQLEEEIRVMNMDMCTLKSEYEESTKKVEQLGWNETRLEKELAHSEYLRLQHEKLAKSSYEELGDMKLEHAQLRKDLSQLKQSESESSSALQAANERVIAMEAEVMASRTALMNIKDNFNSETSQQAYFISRGDYVKISNDLTASREVLGVRVGELNASRAEVENLKCQLEEAQQYACKLDSEKTVELNELKREMSRLEELASSRSKAIEEMEAAEKSLMRDLKIAQQEIKDIHEANSKIIMEDTTMDSMEADLNELRLKSVELAHARAEIQRLQDLDKNNSALLEQIHELKTSNELLGKDLVHVQAQMVDTNMRASSCENDLEEERKRNSSLIEEITGLRSEMIAISKASEKEIKELLDKSDEESKQLHELLNQSKANQERLACEYMDKYAAMQEDTYKLAVQLAAKSTPDGDEIGRYQALVFEKDATIERLTCAYDSVQYKLRQYEELHDTPGYDQSGIMEELRALTEKIKSLENDIKEKDELLKSQSSALDESDDVTAQLEREIDAYKDEIEKLRKLLSIRKSENDNLQFELANVESMKRELLSLRQSLREMRPSNVSQGQYMDNRRTSVQGEALHVANSEIDSHHNSTTFDVNHRDDHGGNLNRSGSYRNMGSHVFTSDVGAEIENGGIPSPEATNDYQPKVSSVVDKFESTSRSLQSSSPKKNPFSL